MSVNVTLLAVMGVMFATGIYLLLERSLTRVLLGIVLIGNGANLLILATGGIPGLAPLYVAGTPAEDYSDPLPQALILTAIVITFGISAFVLAMIHRSWALARNEAVANDEEDRRIAARHDTDADELDPDELAPEDRPAGHADSPSRRRRPATHPTELADDVALPVSGDGR